MAVDTDQSEQGLIIFADGVLVAVLSFLNETVDGELHLLRRVPVRKASAPLSDSPRPRCVTRKHVGRKRALNCSLTHIGIAGAKLGDAALDVFCFGDSR